MTTASPLTLRDLESLGYVRDELRLQAHLFKAELNDRWLDAEAKWQHLQHQARAVANTLQHSSEEVGTAARLMRDTVRETYVDLRLALKNLSR